HSPTEPPPSGPTSSGLARPSSGHAPAGPPAAVSSRSGSPGRPATPLTARSRRRSAPATMRGSKRPSPTRASPPTSRPGGPIPPRAARDTAERAPIGYRRAPVTIRHEGWALDIPGSYAERRTPDEWWGGGAGRNITLAAVRTATASGAMGAQTFVDQFGGDLGPDA